MSTIPRTLLSAGGALVLVAGVAACAGDDDATIDDLQDDPEGVITDATEDLEEVAAEALEIAARNTAVQLAPDHFAAAGHPISGQLACSATAADALTSVEVECSGVTEAGDQAELTGTMTELPGEVVIAVDGQFTGTVDGEQVFQTDRLGD